MGADLGGAPMATRMVGGFILVAFLFCLLLAWPGRRRWPVWLIGGMGGSVCAALVLAITPDLGGWLDSMRAAAMGLAVLFVATATVRDLRDPGR
jgi:peptidoglycan/LPS O-acetylase OafA/YrhL